VGYTEKVVVIGAGISGLACAFRLKQLGLSPLVLEASSRPGGAIETVRRNGFLFELGPQCPRFPASVWSLVHALGLESQFLPGDPKATRYILKDGALELAPFSPAGLFSTQLLSAKSKFRLLSEVFRNSSPPPQEESLAEFVQRKFGTEVLDYLVDPLVSTVFFGDASKMGMQSAFPALVEWEHSSGSLIRGALRSRKKKNAAAQSSRRAPSSNSASKSGSLRVTDSLPSLGSFQSGMAALPERLAKELQGGLRYNQQITALTRSSAGGCQIWEIHLENGEPVSAESLIFAVPAFAAAILLKNTAPQLASLLNAIEYAPLCAVATAYNRSQVSHDLRGFGFMAPRAENRQTICTFWNSSLFPGRAPAGKVVLTTFAGRQGGDPVFFASEAECAQLVEKENAEAMGISGPPLDRVVWRSPRALPQYNVGHAQRVREIAEALRGLPNLQIVGNFLTGRSIGDCVQFATQAAENLHSRLRGENI
jgi:oxygen-dependent protoporphyrinogen oxidase